MKELLESMDRKLDNIDNKLDNHLNRIAHTEADVSWLKGHVKIVTAVGIAIIGSLLKVFFG